MCHAGIMKQILDGSSQFRIYLDNLKPSSGWINHSDSKQRVFLEWGLYCKRTHQIMTQGKTLLFWEERYYIS
jgi:hypothetical protein